VNGSRADRLAAYRTARRRYRPDPRQFERLVWEALASLPPEFRSRLDNLALVVQDWPTFDQLQRQGMSEHEVLFGLYEGTPLGERDTGYSMVVPDRIVVFKGPLLAHFQTRAELVREIRLTVLHEIGHYFGLSEHELP